jgi:hypothetical protein
VRSSQGGNARLGQAEVLDLALCDQVADRAGDVLDGNLRVDPVLIEEIDRLDAEPLERAVYSLADVVRPAGDAAKVCTCGGIDSCSD